MVQREPGEDDDSVMILVPSEDDSHQTHVLHPETRPHYTTDLFYNAQATTDEHHDSTNSQLTKRRITDGNAPRVPERPVPMEFGHHPLLEPITASPPGVDTVIPNLTDDLPVNATLDFFDPFLGLSPSLVQDMGLQWAPFNTNLSPLDYMQIPNHSEASTDYNLESVSRESRLVTASAQRDVMQPPNSTIAASSVSDTDIAQNSSILPLDQSRLARPAIPALSDRAYANILRQISAKTSADEMGTLSFPNCASLKKCLTTYIDVFHQHFPILHLPTMQFDETCPALLLAMCAIRALYRLERTSATQLYLIAEGCLDDRPPPASNMSQKVSRLAEWQSPGLSRSRVTPDDLGVSQARLLLVMFGSFGGHTDMNYEAFSHMGMGLQVCSSQFVCILF